MGSLEEEEEERLVRMVHDFIESSPSPSPSPTWSKKYLQDHLPARYFLTLKEILSGSTEVEKEVLGRVKKHIMRSRSKSRNNGLNKCLARKLKSDGFNASLCHSSWATSLGCPAGDYEFVDIMVEDEHGGESVRLILDTEFKSQFELARPTPEYKELTHLLPSIFIGQEEKLNKTISLVCSAAKQSLLKTGLHVPSWRTSTYMHSKWLSAGCQKCADHNREETGSASASVGSTMRNAFGGGSSASGAAAACSGLSRQFSNMRINCC